MAALSTVDLDKFLKSLGRDLAYVDLEVRPHYQVLSIGYVGESGCGFLAKLSYLVLEHRLILLLARINLLIWLLLPHLMP